MSRFRFVNLVSAAALVAVGGCSSRAGGPPAGGGRAETSAAQCSDGRDNDGDGAVDCSDVACSAHAWCAMAVDSGVDGPVDDGGPRPDVPVSEAGPWCGAPIDVVFVIDVSTSMHDEVAGIDRGIESIWTAATALGASVQFSLVVFVDNALRVDDCAPFPDHASLSAELRRWRDFTSSNEQPAGGPFNSDCPENSLDALYLAATGCPWRAGATRIAIHVTDDTFAERPARLASTFGTGGIPVERTYAETVAALRANEVRVGAFAAPGAGEWCGAGTSPNVGQGFHEPYMGMPSIPEATGGRVWSIRDVRAGVLDMAVAINELIADEHCTLY
ncbi:MAG: hypothetical protein NZ898_10350 [Myxococcota bacterium]|nr:hypothetical protein [Myxococcota bacterium]MDW8361772.1 vWA domain-containing protein [Myxococcales bacterium]